MAKKKKTTGKKARNKVLRRQRRWKLCMIGGGVALSALAALIGWQVYNGKFVETTGKFLSEAYAGATAATGFAIKNIAVEGRERTDKHLLMEAIDTKPKESLLALSIDEVKERIEKISTIREARVERRLPDTLHITLVERTPMAVWQNKGTLSVIDRDGVVLKEENPAHYKHLLVVVGTQAPEKLDELLGILKQQPQLASKVVAAVRVGERRWDIKMQQGVKVMLPEEHAEKAWDYLAELERDRQILSNNLRQIDLRLDEKAFIRLTPQQNSPDKEKVPAREA